MGNGKIDGSAKAASTVTKGRKGTEREGEGTVERQNEDVGNGKFVFLIPLHDRQGWVEWTMKEAFECGGWSEPEKWHGKENEGTLARGKDGPKAKGTHICMGKWMWME
jgi:hypothetical protein